MKTTMITRVLSTAGLVASLTLGAATVQAADRPDSWVTLKTKLALMTADGVDTWDLNVDTKNGEVTLHGKVASDAARTKAESVAKGIDGTKSVKNLLQVVPKPQRDAVEQTDDAIKSGVERALKTDASLSNVNVASVNKGVVLLNGSVDTLGAHVKAIEVASSVTGVRRVSTNVTSKGDAE
jgi:hyperosmotically inducible protein